MENLSKYLTNGEDPIAEIPPRIEGASVAAGASRIIEALGYDRSTDERDMQEAEWNDESDNKHRLKREIDGDNTWYFLDVYKSLQNDKPFLRYGYLVNQKHTDVRMYDPDTKGRKKLDIDKPATEQAIIERLAGSGVFSAEKATTDQEDAKFWDIALHTISERSIILGAVKRGQDSPVYITRDRIYDEARHMIETQEKGLPPRAVDRVIDLAMATIYPSDQPELPPASSDIQ